MSKFGKFDLSEFDAPKEKHVSDAKPETKKQSVEHAPKKVDAVKATGVAQKCVVPMMNIRFTPENYEYMRKEAAMRGLSVIKFTNWIIDQYRADPTHVHQNDVYQNEDKW